MGKNIIRGVFTTRASKEIYWHFTQQSSSSANRIFLKFSIRLTERISGFNIQKKGLLFFKNHLKNSIDTKNSVHIPPALLRKMPSSSVACSLWVNTGIYVVKQSKILAEDYFYKQAWEICFAVFCWVVLFALSECSDGPWLVCSDKYLQDLLSLA